jgi:hypothetical protein
MATDFIPVQVGSISIRDPLQLKAAFPDQAAYNAIMEYFPATKQRPPLQSIPDDIVDILIRAFKLRIQGLRSVSASRMSKISGYKNSLMSTELVHLIAQLQGRNTQPANNKPSKKKGVLEKVLKLSGDQRRTLIFKLLWDLFHYNQLPADVQQSWESIVEEITKNAPYNALLTAAGTNSKAIGTVDMGALDESQETEALKKFSGAAPTASPADQLKIAYAVSHLFNIAFDGKTTHIPLINKMKNILNAYTAFYSTRFPTLIREPEGLLIKFYKKNNKIDIDTFLRLYKIISEIQDVTNRPFWKYMGEKVKNSIVIKLTGFTKPIQELIKAYSDMIANEDTPTKTNKAVAPLEGRSEIRKLYALNVLDTRVVQIIAGNQMKSPQFNKPPEEGDQMDPPEERYSSEEITYIKNNNTKITREVTDYFKSDSPLYLVITNSEHINVKEETVPKVQTLLTYKEGKPNLEEIPSLQMDNPKGSIPLFKSLNKKYIDVQYKPTQIYQSFTLPVLQLLMLIHLKETLKPAAT